jgi:hypothetical protein
MHNVAKYLDGQLVLGINPDPERYDGILCPHPPAATPRLLEWLLSPTSRDERSFRIQQRTMTMVQREDGQRLLALNEVFVGHRTHQSARYRLQVGGREERQSSSGIICVTGTGSTGWARSIARQRHLDVSLQPDEAGLAWFVREPFPSVSTDVDLDFGLLGSTDALDIVSEMGEDGVIFADGIEADRLDFLDGQRATIGVAHQRLQLVVTGYIVTTTLPCAWPVPRRASARAESASAYVLSIVGVTLPDSIRSRNTSRSAVLNLAMKNRSF